jgi:hypothetical protein
MKTEQVIFTVLNGSASPLGSHTFLDEFALTYHRAVADRLRGEPSVVDGQRLRSSSPFAGALSPEERLEILAACEQRATA